GYQTIFDRRRTATQEVRDVLRAYANQPYRPLRRGEFYAAGFLTEQQRLPYGRVLGNTSIPAIPRLTDRSTAITFDQISIQPPRSASYHVGDSLLIVRIDRDITGWGGVVVPLGVARVTELQRRQVLADVIMQFGRIHDGHLALPLEPFKDPGEVHPTPVEGGLEGVVIAERYLHVLAGPQQIVFINRGRAEGVIPGDVFEVFRPAAGVPGTASEQMQVVLQIVHTRDHSASGLILNIGHPKLVPGMPVRLIRKMPCWPCSSWRCRRRARACFARRRWGCSPGRSRRGSSGSRCSSGSRRKARPRRGAAPGRSSTSRSACSASPCWRSRSSPPPSTCS